LATTTHPTGRPDIEIEEPPRSKHARLPSDILRALVAVVVAVAGVLLASAFGDLTVGITTDVIRLTGRLPNPVVVVAILAAQLLALAVPLLVAAALLRNRTYRRLLLVLFAAAVAAIAVVLLENELSSRFVPILDLPVPDWICAVSGEGTVLLADCVEGFGFPSSTYMAGFAAGFSVISPWVDRRWRIAGWALIGFFLIVRSIDGVQAPVDALLVVAVGYAVGAATLLLFAAPDRRPRGRDVAEALDRTGTTLEWIGAVPAAGTGPRRYLARTTGGEALTVEVRGPEEQAADILVDLQRSIRMKGLGDEHPRLSHRRAIEYEAVSSLKAGSDGVRTPRVVSVADVGIDSMLIAFARFEGAPLDTLDADLIDDEVLEGSWEQVAMLRMHRMAHRNLGAGNVVVDSAGDPWLVGFDRAKLAADDGELRSDIAELLFSTALCVGPQRAVSSASKVLGTAALADAAPRLQPMAATSATRRKLEKAKGLDREVQDEVKRVTGIEEIEFEKIERVSRKTILTALALGAAFYFLIPQLAQIDLSEIAGADWEWFVLVLVASLVTYVGAAWSLMGSVPDPVPFLSSLYAQVAASFVNRITPAKVGGMAMNVRFLQKLGLGSTVAVTGVGISNVGGVVVHVVLLVLFAAATGRSAATSIHLPSGTAVLVGLTAVLTLAGLLMLLPWGRKLFLRGVWPIVRKAGGGITQVARNPWRLLQLFGGSFVTTMAYIFALWYSLQAFGGGLGFFAVATVFLAGSAVAQAAPTPGGIGAAEAAFIAALTAFGLPANIAVPAVFMYRFATFWLPIVPGWAAFQRLQTDGAI